MLTMVLRFYVFLEIFNNLLSQIECFMKFFEILPLKKILKQSVITWVITSHLTYFNRARF